MNNNTNTQEQEEQEDNVNLFPKSKSKYNLVVCELFHERMHGFTENSDPNVKGHYLVIERLNEEDEEDEEEEEEDYEDKYTKLNRVIALYNTLYNTNVLQANRKKREWYMQHSFIRNYEYIVCRPNHLKIDIAECLYLHGNECVAIIKTFWIRIIQRVWKKIMQKRREITKKRGSSSSLLYRERTGTWPKDCLCVPVLKGSLNSLVL